MFFIVKAKKTSLRAPLSASALTIPLTELVDSDGDPIAMASFGSFAVVVLKNGDTVEMIKFSAVSQSGTGPADLTVAASGRDLDPIPPYTGHATGKAFPTGTEVIITNDPYTMSRFATRDNDEDIDGVKTFNKFPQINPAEGLPDDNQEVATKAYVDTVAIQGAPSANETTIGLVEVATDEEIDLGAADESGDTGGYLVVTAERLAASKYGANLPTASEKAAMVGGTAQSGAVLGTPGDTNRFVTEQGVVEVLANVTESVARIGAFPGTRQAVSFAEGGAVRAMAGVTGMNNFIGFTDANAPTPVMPTKSAVVQGNSGGTNAVTFNYTAPQGDNAVVVLVVLTSVTASGGQPSFTRWDGVEIPNSVGGSNNGGGIPDFRIYWVPIGSPGVGGLTRQVSISRSSTSNDIDYAIFTVYNVSQTSPSQGAGAGSETGTHPVALTGYEGLIVAIGGAAIGVTDSFSPTGGFREHTSLPTTELIFGSPSFSSTGAAVLFRPATPSGTIAFRPRFRKVGGFAGLVPGSKYYLSTTTPGAISTTISAVEVGFALSDTELFVS